MTYRIPDPPPRRCPGIDGLGPCDKLAPTDHELCESCFNEACIIDYGNPNRSPWYDIALVVFFFAILVFGLLDSLT